MTPPAPIDLWQPAHAARWRPGAGRRVRRIVFHATSGRGEARATAARWSGFPASPKDVTCAHFVIGQEGYCIQVVHLQDIANHAHAASADSIGIELCAREPREFGPSDPGLPPSLVQLAKASQLGAWLCGRLNIVPSRSTIMGHAEADPQTTHTGCPTAAGVDLDALAKAIGERYAALRAGG